MKLTKYLIDQHNIQTRLLDPMGPDELTKIKENAFAIMNELSELIAEYPWKPWKTYDTNFVRNRQRVIEEAVDIFKFFCNILNVENITEEEFDKAWLEKTEIVINRFRNAKPL